MKKKKREEWLDSGASRKKIRNKKEERGILNLFLKEHTLGGSLKPESRSTTSEKNR